MQRKENSDCLPPFRGLATDSIHAGQPPDPRTGAVIPPLSLSTTFYQPTPGQPLEGFEYSRSDNPTRRAYEECVAACEKGKHAIAFASGSACTATILAMLQPGDHVIAIDDVYGGTNRFFRRIASISSKIIFDFVDFNKEGELERAITPKTKLVWLETPTNPSLKIVDIAKTAKVTKAKNLLLVVDNTFMSPYFQRPLSLGADITVHSVSKYINGHSDVIGGIAITNSTEIRDRLKFLQNGIGAIPSPFDCFLAMRGLKTLSVRMRKHEENAMQVAQLLERSPKVEKVLYPGLPSHPGHEIAKKQQTGYGGMITFWIKGGVEQAKQFLNSLKIFAMAESLGGVESLAEHPAIMTHASVPPEQRKQLGISDTMIRLSVGIEDADDILMDIQRALDQVHFPSSSSFSSRL